MPESDKLNNKLAELKLQEEEKATQQLAQKLNLPYVNLILAPISTEALSTIKPEESQKGQVIIFQKENNQLAVGCIDYHNQETQKIINQLKSRNQIKVFIISPHSFRYAHSLYPKIKVSTTPISGQISLSSKADFELQEKINSIDKIKKIIDQITQNQIDISELFKVILTGALVNNASDIHLEAQANQIDIRYRIDGLLHLIYSLPTKFYHLLDQRIKLLSKMKLNLKNVAQDGRFTIKTKNEEIEVRVSTIPGNYGDSIVMRILDPKAISLQLEDLGIRDDLYQILKKEIEQPTGMIITTGPTGSGKTTLLYTILKKKFSPEIKTITLENPIEYHLSGITQTQIEKSYAGEKNNYDFASGLRAILRQDPDIIMVGEIRDKETAQTAVQAALTGHLVFSTIHTNDAAGAIPRFINFGIDSATLASALRLIVAQRLVRRVCPFCQEEYQPSQDELAEIKKATENLPADIKPNLENITLRRGKGCPKCNQTGYKGRIGIFELIPITKTMEKVIISNPNHYQIQQQTNQEKMTTMYQDGILKVVQGVTTLDEIKRVTGDIH